MSHKQDGISRIIAACETPNDGSQLGQRGSAMFAASVIDNVAGARVRTEYADVSEDNDVLMSPLLLARLLRAARGEDVELGRTLWRGQRPIDAARAAALRQAAELVRAELRHTEPGVHPLIKRIADAIDAMAQVRQAAAGGQHGDA